jgi:UDP-N-acetylmuramoyl-tripeptide--D-alanyl-D-alanine ligase
MGARKCGEINELCQLISPQMGIVTSVGRQHTNTFGNIEQIYKTKKELPDYLNKQFCVFNIQNRLTHRMYDEYVGDKVGVFFIEKKNALIKNRIIKYSDECCERFRYGVKIDGSRVLYEMPHKFNYYAKNIKKTEFGVEFDVYEGFENQGSIFVKLLGVHNVVNCLLSVAMARRLGLSWQKIKLGLGKLKPIDARLQKIDLDNGAVVINNGYNSNLDSARESLKVLNVFNRLHRVVITPGIIETSDDFAFNREFGKLVSKYATDVIIVKNKNKDAILAGLSESCFDMNRVFFANDFRKVKNVLSGANEDYVFLIENDLPDNFK